MLIETSIKARREKTVRLTTPKGNTIVFADDGAGHLVAEVTDEDDLAFALSRGEFSPLDEVDFMQARSLLLGDAGSGDSTDGGSDDLPDDEGDENAAPVEVVTPPKPAEAGKATKADKAAKAEAAKAAK